MAHFVEAVGAAAFGPAMFSFGETFAVQFEAFRATALAFVGKWHRL